MLKLERLLYVSLPSFWSCAQLGTIGSMEGRLESAVLSPVLLRSLSENEPLTRRHGLVCSLAKDV